MRLNELNPKPSEVSAFAKAPETTGTAEIHRFKKWGDLADNYAFEHGFHRLGSGQFAGVYGHPTYPYVIRIFAKGDEGYIKWLKFCLAHQGNRFIPKFKGKPVQAAPSLYVVRMERLKPIPSSQEDDIRTLSWVISHYSLMMDPDQYAQYTEETRLAIERLFPDFRTDADLKEIGLFMSPENNRDVVEDIHDENVMLRGEQMVITDPFAPKDWWKRSND